MNQHAKIYSMYFHVFFRSCFLVNKHFQCVNQIPRSSNSTAVFGTHKHSASDAFYDFGAI